VYITTLWPCSRITLTKEMYFEYFLIDLIVLQFLYSNLINYESVPNYNMPSSSSRIWRICWVPYKELGLKCCVFLYLEFQTMDKVQKPSNSEHLLILYSYRMVQLYLWYKVPALLLQHNISSLLIQIISVPDDIFFIL
jgi:hypothetical protein